MFEEWVSTEMMVLKVIDDDKAAANTFFKETALPLARNLETWIPTEIDNAPAFRLRRQGAAGCDHHLLGRG